MEDTRSHLIGVHDALLQLRGLVVLVQLHAHTRGGEGRRQRRQQLLGASKGFFSYFFPGLVG